MGAKPNIPGRGTATVTGAGAGRTEPTGAGMASMRDGRPREIATNGRGIVLEAPGTTIETTVIGRSVRNPLGVDP